MKQPQVMQQGLDMWPNRNTCFICRIFRLSQQFFNSSFLSLSQNGLGVYKPSLSACERSNICKNSAWFSLGLNLETQHKTLSDTEHSISATFGSKPDNKISLRKVKISPVITFGGGRGRASTQVPQPRPTL